MEKENLNKGKILHEDDNYRITLINDLAINEASFKDVLKHERKSVHDDWIIIHLSFVEGSTIYSPDNK